MSNFPPTDADPQTLNLQTLEDRILYSAAPVPMDMAVQVDAIDNAVDTLLSMEPNDWQPADDSAAALTLGNPETPAHLLLTDEVTLGDESLATANNGDSGEDAATQPELVVVDRSVEGYEQLVADLAQSGTGRSLEVIYVDSDESGVDKLTEHLTERSANGEPSYSAIHLISHGRAGELNLGSDQVNQSSIDSFADSFEQWSSALTDQADVLIYGCDVAGNEDGTDLLATIANLTSADVAASDDLTGHASLNGDWDLEFVYGHANTNLVFSQSLQDSWQHTLVTQNIVGVVLEDVNGDGSLSDGVGIENVTVRLFLDDGDGELSEDDTYVADTTTNAAGEYVFLGSDILPLDYFVVVDSKTIRPSQGLHDPAGQSNIWAEQTYASAGALQYAGEDGDSDEDEIEYETTTENSTLFGGLSATRSDDARDLTTAEHIISVSTNPSGNRTADFGFSFNAVTNTSGGGDDAANTRTVQGSLDQFIRNANEIAGDNEMRFVATDDANSYDGTVWQIELTESLTHITDSGTVIDGTVYSTDGGPVIQSNETVIGQQKFVGADNDYEFTGFAPLQLEITADQSLPTGDQIEYGLVITTAGDNDSVSDVTIRNVSVHGFGTATPNTPTKTGANILVSSNGVEYNHTNSFVSGVTIENNLIGISADGSVSESSRPTSGVKIYSANSGVIQDNYIGHHGAYGIQFVHQLFGAATTGSDNWSILRNQIVENGQNNDLFDGVLLSSATNAVVQHNEIAENAGFGIETLGSEGGYLISGNTIRQNGTGGLQQAGIRAFGNGSTISSNLFQDHAGAGVLVTGFSYRGTVTFDAATNNLIRSNSFQDIGGIGIDLNESLSAGFTFEELDSDASGFLEADEIDPSMSEIAPGTSRPSFINQSQQTLERGDGETLTEGLESSTGNEGLDQPEVIEAKEVGIDVFRITIEVPPEASHVEFYNVSNTVDGGTAFDPIIRIPLSSMNDLGGQRYSYDLAADNPKAISAIAFSSDNNTSEFGNTLAVTANSAPSWDRTIAERTVEAFEDTTYEFEADFFRAGFNDIDGDNLESIRIDSLPSSGTLFLIDPLDGNKTPVTTGDSIPTASLDGLIFEPETNANGDVTFNVSPSDQIQYSDESYVVTIRVAPVNDAPVIEPLNAFETNEDETLNGANLLDGVFDEENDSLSLIAETQTGDYGVVEFNSDGTFVYTPNENAFGEELLTYTVTDGTNEVTGELQIVINSVNDAPVVTTEQDLFVDENELLVAELTGTDAEDTTLTYRITGGADGEHFSIVNGNELTFNNAPDYENATDSDGDNVYHVTVDALDSEGLSSEPETALAVHVDDANESPFWSELADDASNTEITAVGSGPTLNGTQNLLPLFEDSDAGDELTVVVVTQAGEGTVEILPDGSFTYQPNSLPFLGTDTFQIAAVDSGGLQSDLITITVTAPAIRVPANGTTDDNSNEETEDELDPVVANNRPANSDEDDDEFATEVRPVNARPPSSAGISGNDLEDKNPLEIQDFELDLADDQIAKTYGYALKADLSLATDEFTDVASKSRSFTAKAYDLDALATAFLQGLEESKADYLYTGTRIGTSEIAASAASLLTVSYVAWNMGSPILFSTFLSSLPAWASFDVLPVIAGSRFKIEDDETIEQIVDVEK